MDRVKDLFISPEFLAKTRADEGARGLFWANVATAAVALLEGWTLGETLVIYWWQSVIIGGFYVWRILDCKKVDMTVRKEGDISVPVPEVVKIVLAGFFIVHYGGFHMGYAAFLSSYFKQASNIWVLAAVFFFLVNQFMTFFKDREKNRSEGNIVVFFMFPYARIFPMHIIIIFGTMIMMILGGVLGQTGQSAGEKVVLLIFIALKTKADLFMHHMEKDPKMFLAGLRKQKAAEQGR